MRHVQVSRFEHLVLQLRLLGEGHGSQGCDAEQRRNVCFSLGTSILRLRTVEQAWTKKKQLVRISVLKATRLNRTINGSVHKVLNPIVEKVVHNNMQHL